LSDNLIRIIKKLFRTSRPDGPTQVNTTLISYQSAENHSGFASANNFSGRFSFFTAYHRNFRTYYRFYWYC